MKIATFNINSINARVPILTKWLGQSQPDVVLLQEIKCEFNAFPFFEISSLGYDVHMLGQKSYNGVAILSKSKIKNVVENLPQFPDAQARYLQADVTVDGKDVTVASIYLPNGNPPLNAPDDTQKFLYKLQWMDALYQQAQALLQSGKRIVLGGDFNTILTDNDVYDPEEFRNNALFRPEVRRRFEALKFLGYTDAFRALYPLENGYSFWDYTSAALQLDKGMRIDYFLLSPLAADELTDCFVDKEPRKMDKPSDHTPLVAQFK